MKVNYCDVLEHMFRGLIKGGMPPSEIFIALNNAFVHGDIFKEYDISIMDEDLDKFLDKFYEGIEISSKACKDMEKKAF